MIDASATLAALELMSVRLDGAMKEITGDAARRVQFESMKEAPVGILGNSTNDPGDLLRSIDVTGPHGEQGRYEARVGPTVIYARQRELGGDIYPVTARKLRFTKFGETVYTSHVYQKPNPYMLRGEMASIPKIELAAKLRLAVAIVGS